MNRNSRRGNSSQCIKKSDLSYYLNRLLKSLKSIECAGDQIQFDAMIRTTVAITNDLVSKFDLRGVKF